MLRLDKKKTILHDSDGSAVVEATFVFPLMFIIFFALVLLALYLPQRAMLQRATQLAATAVATEMSDTWVYYDTSNLKFARYTTYNQLRTNKGGVYKALFSSIFGSGTGGAEAIVKNMDGKENIPVIANGDLTVECEMTNYVVYKEIAVTATRSIPVPAAAYFAVVKFPETIDLTVTSRAVVQNADEFIRNIDLLVEFVEWAAEKLGISDIFEKVQAAGQAIGNFFGI